MRPLFLHDSRGNYIAYMYKDRLHATTGQNIGYIHKENIALDMFGNYLGHIVKERRLMEQIGYNPGCYGSRGNYGNQGNYGNPGNIGSIGAVSGYRDIESSKTSLVC